MKNNVLHIIHSGLLFSMLTLLITHTPKAFSTKMMPEALKQYIIKNIVRKKSDLDLIREARRNAAKIFDVLDSRKHKEIKELLIQDLIKNIIEDSLKKFKESPAKGKSSLVAFKMHNAQGNSMLYEAIDQKLESLIVPLIILGKSVKPEGEGESLSSLITLAKERDISTEIITIMEALLQKNPVKNQAVAEFLQRNAFYNYIKPLLGDLRKALTQVEGWEFVDWEEDEGWELVEYPEVQKQAKQVDLEEQQLRQAIAASLATEETERQLAEKEQKQLEQAIAASLASAAKEKIHQHQQSTHLGPQPKPIFVNLGKGTPIAEKGQTQLEEAIATNPAERETKMKQAEEEQRQLKQIPWPEPIFVNLGKGTWAN